MANLPESSVSTATYTAGVYQLETTDPVQGGAAGVSNLPLINLANRTQYLKNRVDNQLVIGTNVQAWGADLDAIEALSGTGVLRRTGTNTWAFVTNWVDNSVCQGRLSLGTDAVTTTDVTAATTVYFVPYNGNRLALWTGAEWVLYEFSTRSLSLSGAGANTNFDIFIYDNSGTITLERVAWTNGTTRATALQLRNGVWVSNADNTRRYVGTIRTTGTAGQSEDSATKRFCWSAYHRTHKRILKEITGSWVYNSATLRPANNDSTHRVETVVGLSENLILVNHYMAGTTGALVTEIGVNSTTVGSASFVGESAGTGDSDTPVAILSVIPSVGYTYYQALEATALSVTIQKSNLIGQILC